MRTNIFGIRMAKQKDGERHRLPRTLAERRTVDGRGVVTALWWTPQQNWRYLIEKVALEFPTPNIGNNNVSEKPPWKLPPPPFLQLYQNFADIHIDAKFDEEAGSGAVFSMKPLKNHQNIGFIAKYRISRKIPFSENIKQIALFDHFSASLLK